MSAKIRIDLADVRRAGSVSAAIVEAAERSGTILLATPAAMDGQTFTTSGLGPGLTQQFGADDYARAAIRGHMAKFGVPPSDRSVIDPKDGRLAHGVDSKDADEWDGELEWERESCVELFVPGADDALEFPQITRRMVEAVIAYHSAQSDRAGWRKLIEAIREAAASFDGIDLDNLTPEA